MRKGRFWFCFAAVLLWSTTITPFLLVLLAKVGGIGGLSGICLLILSYFVIVVFSWRRFHPQKKHSNNHEGARKAQLEQIV